MRMTKRLEDMLSAIQAIEGYQVSSFEEFKGDERTQDAVMYNLIILGEAANQIEDSFREEHPKVPWSSIIGTRNVIVHGYDQVKLQIVWEIIQRDLQELKQSILDLLE
ncbi:MAG: DUF86 domain-containing protein [Chloroflexi bacterium]|nr:MAG: DUF86 domain-containing protein [Chloroflexota bacterium]MBL1195150.1 DUF86 domain-containing protein [Chloroflexota bacterium]NOH12435.1 DUF86 domain-containing protein [Chloroflexota bacterium]